MQLLKILIAATAIFWVTAVSADSGVRRTPCGYQQATVDTATLLTVPTTCGTITFVRITPEAQAVRYRDDGVAPTATVGMPLAVAVTLDYDGTPSKIQFISQTAGAKINVSYYR